MATLSEHNQGVVRVAAWAHSGNDGAGRWQPLVEHLRATAELAEGFAAPFGAGEIGYWLGLLHDVGKAACGWQEKLELIAGTGQRVGLDHKLAGARLAAECGLGKYAIAIQGHHGGMESPDWLRNRLRSLSPEEQAREADARRKISELLPELSSTRKVRLPEAWRGDPLVGEMGLRLVFSALCDADFLDTAAHFADAGPVKASPEADFAALCRRFERGRAELLRRRRPGRIDEVREEVYRACLKAAECSRGVFRLAAAPGTGKTLSAGAFALRHAATHEMRRVVVAVPFLTITEQNADVYRGLLDQHRDRVVLEHHSGVDFDRPEHSWARLAADNWSAPFVVTTQVRLFESLFDRRPAAMRRLHRLAGSVIVLDEVQALPHHLLVPILDALRTLVDHFDVTVVLASATQPEFWHLTAFSKTRPLDILGDSATLAEKVRRVRFEWRVDPSPSLAECAAEAAEQGSALVVVNTTADAKTVFDAWRSHAASGVAWHLSTRMCGAHRRRVLAAVRARLAAGQPVLLVSTQLIEAGVDVDFPLVYRVIAPADSISQAAGRANREGGLADGGRVVIIDPPDAGMPPGYRSLVDLTRAVFRVDSDDPAEPDDPEALSAYYRLVYSSLNLEGPRHLGQRIQRARGAFDFRTVTDGPEIELGKRDPRGAFRMIREDGVTVVTAGGAGSPDEEAEVAAMIRRVRTAAHPKREDLRKLQPYLTTIHPSALHKPGVPALMEPIIGEKGRPGSLAEWIGGYDPDTGIDLDPRTEEFVG